MLFLPNDTPQTHILAYNPKKPFSAKEKGFQIALKALLAENTRFELVRLLHQHAFQACAIDH